MDQFEEYLKSTTQDFIDVINSIIYEKKLLDIGYVVGTDVDGKYKIRSFAIRNGVPVEYTNVEILYPSGINFDISSAICLVFKIYSPVLSTKNHEDNTEGLAIPPYDIATVKAIPLSNMTSTEVTAGYSGNGGFNIGNAAYSVAFLKDMIFMHNFAVGANVTLAYDDKNNSITANIVPAETTNMKYFMQFLLSNDGYALSQWDAATGKCLHASVTLKTGEIYNYYISSNSAFKTGNVVKLSDITGTAMADWKRIEKYDTDGVLTAAPGELFTSATRKFATYEDVYLLYLAIINHQHTVQYSWTDSGGSSTVVSAKTTYATNEPKPVAGFRIAQETS